MKRLIVFMVLVLLSVSVVTAQDGGIAGTHQDPNGLFSVPIPTNWTATDEADYTVIAAPEDSLMVYAMVVEGDSAEAAITDAWETVGITISAAATPQTIPSSPGFDETVLINYATGNEPPFYQGLAQRIGGENYVLLFVVNSFEAAATRSAQIQIIASGFRPTSAQQDDISGVEPLIVDAALIESLEAFITDNLTLAEVPGVSIAIVQNGEIVYANGFGVKTLGTNEPITADTLMMIGSVTKSFTTMLMGTLVDDGALTWDTPVVDILPNFAVADAELTPTITIRNMVCACTGVPRRDLEFIFNFSSLTGEDTVESLQTFRFFTDFGEAFQYSNQMVATGGFAATVAAGGEYGSLLEDYDAVLHERVLDPLGMTRTTFDINRVFEDGDYAIPHSARVDETGVFYESVPVTLEGLLIPIAPAGALWSSANEMARYLLTELAFGVAPDGTQVISQENLLTTWEPQIALSADISYGLGWFVGDYKGTTLIYHGGNTIGFTADAAFLPEKELGIVVLANGQGANSYVEAIRTRFLELVFEIETGEAEAGFAFMMQRGEEAEPELVASIGDFEDEAAYAAAEALVGEYVDDVLGELTITFDGGVLLADAGEFISELRPMIGEDADPNTYIMLDPPLAGSLLEFDPDAGTLTIDITTDQYVFERQ